MKVITLNREYGAGGHSIGWKVAEELGLPFYDKDIIREEVRASGFDMDLVEQESEEISRLESVLSVISNISSGYYNDSHEKLEEIQKAVILDFARKGPCVILGRCADDILRKAGIDCFNVFIYADEIVRAKRVGELIGSNDPGEIRRAMTRRDSARRNYYYRFTGQKWGVSSNYHICLDSGFLGYDRCTEIICSIAKTL